MNYVFLMKELASQVKDAFQAQAAALEGADGSTKGELQVSDLPLSAIWKTLTSPDERMQVTSPDGDVKTPVEFRLMVREMCVRALVLL